MTINEMRNYISSKYDSMSWKDRVSKMPTRQVVAVYKNIKHKEEFKNQPVINPSYHQIDMFEYLYSINQDKETNTEVKV